MVEPWLRHVARTAPQVSTAHAKIGTNPTRKVRKDSSHGRAMAQACRIDFSKIVRARAARRADSAASFYHNLYSKTGRIYLQWRRRYREYRYWGTFFRTLYMSQLVL